MLPEGCADGGYDVVPNLQFVAVRDGVVQSTSLATRLRSVGGSCLWLRRKGYVVWSLNDEQGVLGA